MLATLETPKKATLLRWSSETIFINFQIACSKLGVGSDIFFGLYSSSHMLTYCTLAKQTATNSQHSGYTQLKHATPGKIKSVRGFAWKGLRSGISAFWWPFVPHNHLKTRIRCQIYQPTHMQCLHASFYWQQTPRQTAKFHGDFSSCLKLDLRPLQCRKLAVCLFLASASSKPSHFGRSISKGHAYHPSNKCIKPTFHDLPWH